MAADARINGDIDPAETRERACWTRWSARPSTSPTAASTPTSTQRPRPSGRAVATTARSSRSRSVRSPPTPEATSPDSSRSPSGRPPFPVRTTIRSSTSPSIRSQPWPPRWVAISNVRSTSCVWPASTACRRRSQTVAGRLQIHCLLIGGRADEAVEVARKLLAGSNDRVAPYLWAISRWMAGEPSDLVALGRPPVDLPALNSRDEFVRRTLVASLLASTGRRDEVHRLVEGHGGAIQATGELTNTRDAVLDAVARALCALVDHDEAGAARLVAGVAAAHARQPDPGSAPAPVPADRLRARPRAARPLGRRHARPDAPRGASHQPPPGRPARRSSRRAVRRRSGPRVHGAAVGVVDRAGLPPACRPAPERSAPRRMARRPGSRTGAGRAAPPGRARVERRQRRRRTICSPTSRRCRRSRSRSASSARCRSRSTG